MGVHGVALSAGNSGPSVLFPKNDHAPSRGHDPFWSKITTHPDVRIILFGVDTAADLALADSLGVHAVMTDSPRAMKKLMAVPKAVVDARVKAAKEASPRAGNPDAPGRKRKAPGG